MQASQIKPLVDELVHHVLHGSEVRYTLCIPPRLVDVQHRTHYRLKRADRVLYVQLQLLDHQPIDLTSRHALPAWRRSSESSIMTNWQMPFASAWMSCR